MRPPPAVTVGRRTTSVGGYQVIVYHCNPTLALDSSEHLCRRHGGGGGSVLGDGGAVGGRLAAGRAPPLPLCACGPAPGATTTTRAREHGAPQRLLGLSSDARELGVRLGRRGHVPCFDHVWHTVSKPIAPQMGVEQCHLVAANVTPRERMGEAARGNQV